MRVGASFILLATAHAGSYFELHAADSGSQVRRDWLPQEQCHSTGPDKELAIDMVRNEHEAVQLVVLVPSYETTDLHGGTWSVGPLVAPGGATIPAADVVVTPIGFVG